MTSANPIPPVTSAAPAAPVPWEICDHCQAPLDSAQRYCVVCGAHRPHGDDPVARYFAAGVRRARAAETAAPQTEPPARSGPALAVAIALLPVAAAAGIMVGRGSSSDGDAVIRALKAQKAPIVNVVGGGARAAGDTTSTVSKPKARQEAPSGGKVIARTRYGSARQLTGARVTRRQIEESRRAIQHIVSSQGRAYVDQQRHLPDQIVIP